MYEHRINVHQRLFDFLKIATFPEYLGLLFQNLRGVEQLVASKHYSPQGCEQSVSNNSIRGKGRYLSVSITLL